MNHNKYNLQIGDECLLDENSACEQTVEILEFTPNKMFATIKNHFYDNTNHEPQSWDVMTYRLTPLKK